MNGSAPDLILTETGCNFCDEARKSSEDNKKLVLHDLLWKILKDGQERDYDVLMGLSGGADSSTALHHIVSLGLRPYCFSMDNGWQTPEADENIMRLVEGLNVPFYRYVIDQGKFRELQSAFLKAGLINAEIPTDHILTAAAYELANKYGIKWIISGGNTATESIMPPSWSYPARDLTHIKDVYRKVMGREIKGLPMMGILKFNFYQWVKGIRTVNLLDYFPYDRTEAVKLLEDKYGYKSYGEKHEESLFTKWFQNFYLFTKFGIDKRIAHYSSLIVAGQMTRSKAVELLQASPVYPKFGIESRVLKYPKRDHKEFKTDEKLWNFLCKVVRFVRIWKF